MLKSERTGDGIPDALRAPPLRPAAAGGLGLRETTGRDLARHYGRVSPGLFLRAALFKRTFRPVLTHRLYRAAKERGGGFRMLLPLLRLLHRWSCGRLSLELPLGTRIGPGFRIIHGFGLVVNEHAVIGEDVTVFHGVTIGQRDRIDPQGRSSRHARIGDRVMLGPYSQILGVSVGEGSVVAPLTAVYRDIPPRVAVGGSPARILRRDIAPDVRHGCEEPPA